MGWLIANDKICGWLLFPRIKILPQFWKVRSSGLARQPEGLPRTEEGIYPIRDSSISAQRKEGSIYENQTHTCNLSDFDFLDRLSIAYSYTYCNIHSDTNEHPHPNGYTNTYITLTPIPTATKELTLEEKFGYLVPVDEKVVLHKAGEYFIGDRDIPSGTKYTGLQFLATGESRREQSSLGEVATVQLVFRDNDRILRDIWMIFAGYNFGENKDGTNFMVISEGAGGSSKIGAPEELSKFSKSRFSCHSERAFFASEESRLKL